MSIKSASLVNLAKRLNKPRNLVTKDLFTSKLYKQKVEQNCKAYRRNPKHKNNYEEAQKHY